MVNLQSNNRLSKMTSKSSSQTQLAGISGSSLKISSKPIRLPALSRPSGKQAETNGKTNKAAEIAENKSEQLVAQTEAPASIGDEPLQNGHPSTAKNDEKK